MLELPTDIQNVILSMTNAFNHCVKMLLKTGEKLDSRVYRVGRRESFICQNHIYRSRGIIIPN